MPGTSKGELKGALTEFIKRKSGQNFDLLCTVKSYDTTTMTCYCEPLADFADIQQVRINPTSTMTGVIKFPKVDSVVCVSFLSDSSAYVSAFSDVDEVWLGGESLGGLVITADLVDRLNEIENDINDLKTIIGTTWVPVPNDGGAALKTAAATWSSSVLTPTVDADIENTVIKQGDGTA